MVYRVETLVDTLVLPHQASQPDQNRGALQRWQAPLPAKGKVESKRDVTSLQTDHTHGMDDP